MRKRKPLPVDEIFGSWFIIKEVESTNKHRKVECKCLLCGSHYTRAIADIVRGVSTKCKPCGLKDRSRTNSTHGLSKTRFYRIWQGMKKRCDNPNTIGWSTYGGKGVMYCESWKSFSAFEADMSTGYADHLTLDRIDNSKGYSKENCKWSTDTEQFANKTDSRMITYKGRTQALCAWCTELNLKYPRTKSRLYAGMDLEIVFDPRNLRQIGADK